MSDVKLEFAHRSKAFNGTPLADLLMDLGFAPLDKSHEKSDAVVALQGALNQLGYDCGAADGKFGPGTAAVVRTFQKDVVSKVRSSDFGADSPGDGRADWLTLLTLDAACAAIEGGAGAAAQPAAAPKPGAAPPKPAANPAPQGAGGDPAAAPAAGPAAAPAGGGEAPKPAVKSTVRPGYDLLPADLRDQYLKMSFTLDGEQVDISLEHLIYQNFSRNRKETFNEECKNLLVSLVLNDLQKKEADWLNENIGPALAKGSPAFIMRAFCGKGSPQEIQAVLRIAGHCRKRLGRDWPKKDALSEAMTEFYHHNMGLDCSGFAGNYARAVGSPHLGPETGIPTFAPQDKRRRSVEEILPGDVIIWNPGHIATIQARRADGDFDIVESSGETDIKGLGNSVRRLASAGGDSFLVQKVHPDGHAGNIETVWVSTIK